MGGEREMRKQLFYIALTAVISLMVFWAPFLLKLNQFWGIGFEGRGMETIVQNFDGINFLAIAKSWYEPTTLSEVTAGFDQNQKPGYFAAHYPLTAMVIGLFDVVTTGPQAVLATIVAGNILLAIASYLFMKEVVDNKKRALLLSAIALFLPARMLSVRGVLSSELFFIPLTLLSLIQAKKDKHWGAAIIGSLAVLTRSPGIILFAGYFLAYWRTPRRLLPYFLIPISLLTLWGFYALQYGSILAYFQSGDNLHLFFPPFRVFGTSESWVSGMWREDIIYIYLVFTAGLAMWWQKAKGAMRYYPALFFLTILFVSHRDIARYSLPLSPFVIAGFSSYLTKPWMKWVLLVALIPVYLLGWQFVLSNMQPVSDWTRLL